MNHRNEAAQFSNGTSAGARARAGGGRHFLLASDFDQTLSFNDSGVVLSELVEIPAEEFEKKVALLSIQNFVQQGGELSYLLLHDAEYRRRVRREHLRQAGRQIRLKRNLGALARMLEQGLEGLSFDFHVISAAPQEIVETALEGILPVSHIHGTQLDYDTGGSVRAVVRVHAGYGKVAALDDLRWQAQVGGENVIYVGDGSSDMHVMLHVNRREGLTIGVSQARPVTQIARRSIVSDDALSLLVPVLEELAGWNAARIRDFFQQRGLVIQEWDRVRMDWVTIREEEARGDEERGVHALAG